MSLFLFLYFLTEGVGKSSLISTFVSRYFSEVVPAIMTRVRLPADPHTSCVTTIIDSQGGDAALIQAVSSSLQKRSSDGSLAALLERDTDTTHDVSSATTATGEAVTHVATPARQQHGGNVPHTPTSTQRIDAVGMGPIEHVDSIVLVYDLDRVETFFRLENHWLPLIERCYVGKVRKQFACARWFARHFFNNGCCFNLSFIFVNAGPRYCR